MFNIIIDILSIIAILYFIKSIISDPLDAILEELKTIHTELYKINEQVIAIHDDQRLNE